MRKSNFKANYHVHTVIDIHPCLESLRSSSSWIPARFFKFQVKNESSVNLLCPATLKSLSLKAG